jgi:hypothetical protein
MLNDVLSQAAHAAGGTVTAAAATTMLGPFGAAVAPIGGDIAEKVADDAVTAVTDLSHGDTDAISKIADLAINPADEVMEAAGDVLGDVPVLGDALGGVGDALGVLDDIPVLGLFF